MNRPSQLPAFIDEDASRNHDGAFVFMPDSELWNSLPGDRDAVLGCSLAFVDGHVEHWR